MKIKHKDYVNEEHIFEIFNNLRNFVKSFFLLPSVGQIGRIKNVFLYISNWQTVLDSFEVST
jgi:hypothetical protein